VLNGFDQEVNIAVLEASIELADIFEEHIIAESYMDEEDTVLISEAGMEVLGDMFEEVAPELRAAVFTGLLDELLERDIPFDIEQFKDTA